MAEVVVEHGGTIDKFQGDAVMAVFGAPEPLPDHARARAALRDRDAASPGGAERRGVGHRRRRRAPHRRSGSTPGTVIAGAVGGGGRLEYTVIGDAVNVAQRLQSEADGGEIVAAPRRSARRPGSPCEPIGPRLVKGREEPVEVFRVV